MSSNSKKKKLKLQCLECNAVFDHYYRQTHNSKQHPELLKANKVIKYQVQGAPKDIFAAAKKSSKPSSENKSPEAESSQQLSIEAQDESGSGNSSSLTDNFPKDDAQQQPMLMDTTDNSCISDQNQNIVVEGGCDVSISSDDNDFENSIGDNSENDGDSSCDLTWSSCAGIFTNLVKEAEYGSLLLSEVTHSDRFDARTFVSKVYLLFETLLKKVKELDL